MKVIVDFARETIVYASRIQTFKTRDWIIYILWVGMIFSLGLTVGAFLYMGHQSGVAFPLYVWNIPIGGLIFATAIAFDTIGHRTVYREALLDGEDLVHQITIFAGITSVIALCLCYEHGGFFEIPALVMTVLSFVFSFIDEALHWRRYLNSRSDRIEMWSHFFILTGHMIMMIGWWKWYLNGYQGVSETLSRLQ